MRKLPVVLLVLLVAAAPASTQTVRDTLRMGIQAFEDFNEETAIPLLRTGLNPMSGPTFSMSSN